MWHYFPSFTRAITLEAFMATKIVPCNEWIPENEHESLIITFNKFILCPSYCRSNAGSGKIELSAIDFCHELILCFWEHDRENVLQQAVMVKRGTQDILGRATMIKKSITFSAPSWWTNVPIIGLEVGVCVLRSIFPVPDDGTTFPPYVRHFDLHITTVPITTLNR